MCTRNVARIVVFNPDDEVLLLHYRHDRSLDPEKPELLEYWVPPGGGLRSGESFEDAALRELEEETGIQSASAGSWVWTRRLKLRYQAEDWLQVERYFVVRVSPLDTLRNSTAEEEIADIQWWSLECLRESDAVFFPEPFSELLEPLLQGELPPEPLEIGLGANSAG